MSANPVPDLNETIVSAVKARIEAELLSALSGDEAFAPLVAAALQQPVKVSNDSYRNETEPYLTHVLRLTIQQATKEAVAKLVTEEIGSIEDAVRKALRRDVAQIANTLSQSLVDSAAKGYGVNVELSLRLPRNY